MMNSFRECPLIPVAHLFRVYSIHAPEWNITETHAVDLCMSRKQLCVMFTLALNTQYEITLQSYTAVFEFSTTSRHIQLVYFIYQLN